MNEQDTIHAEDSGSLECIFQDHQKLKDAIWEVYSEHLKAAQEQDIILPSVLSRRSTFQRSQSPRIITGTDQIEDTVQVRDQATVSNLTNKELLSITEANSTSEMERNTNRRSISPQLNEILDLAITMEYEDNQEMMEISSPAPVIQNAGDGKKDEIKNSTLNIEKDFNPQKEEANKCLDINQNMNTNQNYNKLRSWAQTDEEKEKIRHYSTNFRLPGIEQVINKTSFANQRSDYYSRMTASDGNEMPHGTELIQQFNNDQRLLNLQSKQAMSSTDSMSPREGDRYSYPNCSLPGRPTMPRQPGAPESFNLSNERPMTEPQGCRTSPLLNPSVSKSDSWQFSNITQSTSSISLQQPQFPSNVAPQTASGMIELGMAHAGQTSSSIKNNKRLNNSHNQKYKTQSSSGFPVADGAVPSQMENMLSPNAVVTRSVPSFQFQSNNSTNLVKDNDYLTNLHHPSYNSVITSSFPSAKQNQTSIHLGNVNAKKLALGSMTPSPTYSPTEVVSPYGTINSQGVKISPTTPPTTPIRATNTLPCEYSQQQNNFVGQQNFQYTSAGSSTPARQDFNQYTTGQMTTPSGVNLQALTYGPKNSELLTQQGFPTKNKSQWSGSYGNASAQYKNIQGCPPPISSSRVQEFSSPRTHELSSLRRQDLPSTHHQQFTPPCAQQITASRAQEFPYTFNQQFRSPEVPSTSGQDFPSPQGQFPAPRPELHSLQYPQRNSAPTPSATPMDLHMLNLSGTNPFGHQDGTTTKHYTQLTTTKPPRKRRATKGISVAQTKVSCSNYFNIVFGQKLVGGTVNDLQYYSY